MRLKTRMLEKAIEKRMFFCIFCEKKSKIWKNSSTKKVPEGKKKEANFDVAQEKVHWVSGTFFR